MRLQPRSLSSLLVATHGYVLSILSQWPGLTRMLSFTLLVVSLQVPALAQTAQAELPVGRIIPKVACSSDPTETYALYLPSSFSADRKWPIIYLFDPFARGQAAAEL